MTVEEEIQEMLAEFGRAINAHDVRGIGRCWVEEGNFVDLWGRFALGREAVEHMFAREFSGAFAESHFHALYLELHPLSAETVVGECDAVFENVRAPNGRSYDMPHHISAVFVRRDGGWRFLSAHPSLKRA